MERILQEFRAEREQSQQVMADLMARTMELNARVMELLERSISNGNGTGKREHVLVNYTSMDVLSDLPGTVNIQMPVPPI